MNDVKIMLVDDEPRFLSTSQKLFAKKGYNLITAGGGKEALEKIEFNPVDIIILDVKMPGIDGITLLRQIKMINPKIKVILLTGHGTEKYRQLGMESGAAFYLDKPIAIDELINKTIELYNN